MSEQILIAVIAAAPPSVAAVLGYIANRRALKRSVGASPGVPLAKLLERMDVRFDSRLGRMLHAFGAAFGETLANAVEHAHSRFGALVCAQRYETKRLELSVVDLGIGIRQSLARNPSYRTLDDAAAVRCALQQGVSGVELPGRGTGLSELVVRAGHVPRAVIRLLSGTAGVDVHPIEPDPIYYDSSHVVEVPGTWIHVRLES